MPSETAPRTAHDLLDAILAPTGEVAPGVFRPAVREHTREAYDALYRTPQVLPAPVLHALAVVTAEWQGSGALAAWHRAQGADPSLAAADAPADPALAALRDSGSADDAVVILDDRERPVQWYSSRQLERLTEFPAARDENLPVVGDRASLNDALDTMLVSSTSNAIVTGSRNRYLGVIGVETVMDAITSARGATAEQTPDSPRGENTTPAEGGS